MASRISEERGRAPQDRVRRREQRCLEIGGTSVRQALACRVVLNEILGVYGRKVADGEWRDYAIDQLRERAVFSIYRRSSEVPLYRIVKQPPRTARRQGAYSVIAATGLVVERGPDLRRVLRAIDRRLTVVD